MATYEKLAHSSYSDIVAPFESTNGLGVIDSCTTTLTGYTLPVTQFTFTASLTALENTYIGASMDKLIWDMGDGTYMNGLTVTKHYPFPGEYNVTTIFTDQNGVTHKNRLTQKIKVYNYIPDSLVWYTESIADPLGGRPEKVMCGKPSDELAIYRMNSWQSWPAVSGDGGYYINLYATGSRSRPLTLKQYETNPDSHFTPSWRFLSDKNSKQPLERIQTDNEYIYVKVENNELVRTSNEDSSGIFAGTSGQSVVHFLDDTPNRLTSMRGPVSENNAGAALDNTNMSEIERELANLGMEDRDMILYASFDTSKFPVTVDDENITKFDLLKQNYFQIYETQKVGLPISVKYNNPSKLSITSTGIPEPGFDIKNVKFINSPMPVVVRTSDSENNIINTDEVVPLSSRWLATTSAFSGEDITTDTLTAQGLVTMYLSGTDSSFQELESPYASQEDFQTWDIGDFLPDNEKNRHIRLLIADRRTKEPVPVDVNKHPGKMRVVTLLFSEIQQDQQDLLMSTPISDYMYGSGEPKNWFMKSGEIYHGYVLPRSNYKDIDAIDMQINPIDETYPMHGTLLSLVNLHADEIKYQSEDNKYRFVAHTLISPPQTFTYEVVYYYLTNPTNDTLWQIKPVYYREYSYGDAGTTQTYTPPISTQSPGNSGMYGIAVEPLGDVLAVDGDTDKIIRYWRNVTSRGEFAIKDVMPDHISENHWPNDPDAYGYTPSSVSLDENLDYWVTMYDAVSTVKFSGETNLPIAYAVPDTQNFLANPRPTDPPDRFSHDATYSISQVEGRPGEYGENLINPTMVETCKNNDIVVSYTNPLCSFIARYDTYGNMLYKTDFAGEDRFFTGDICVDVSDHIWALSESTGLDEDGMPINEPLKCVLHSFDEQLNLRYSVSSLQGTSYQDMLKPAPHSLEQIEMVINMEQEYDYIKQQYDETALLVRGYGAIENPRLTVYEGNIYHFENQYFNNGKHQLTFMEVVSSDTNLPLSADAYEYEKTGNIIKDNTIGYGTKRTSIYVTEDTPLTFLLVDINFPNTIALVIDVIKKPVVEQRPAETFEYMNNASFVIPDNNNNIWVAWGKRYCSRYNPVFKRFDKTVAVGNPYYDPRYDDDRESTYNRRDNADRRSAIEGISFDTANNLLVIQNKDKNLYALNSDTPTVSAFINIETKQPAASSFNWVESLCSTRVAERDDFLLYPDSYMTKEQIQLFLDERFTGTEQQKQDAYFNYYTKTLTATPQYSYRTNHGANPLSATGFENEICAVGDWTGYKWITKYDNRTAATDSSSGFVSLTGQSEEFTLLPQTGTHEIVKVNESNDFAQNIRSFMKQPTLVNNTKLYNEFNDVVFGTKHSSVHSLGKKIYERIANYVSNRSDIDTCTVDALYSMAQMVNHEMKAVGFAMPAEIQRLVDLLSISFTRLRGATVTERLDFDKMGNWSQQAVGLNLGPELIFVFDWMIDHGYSTGDYTRYNNMYYECLKVPTNNQKPGDFTSDDYWRQIPDGVVRSLTPDQARRKYNNLSSTDLAKYQNFEEYYSKEIPVRAKLIENLQLYQNTKYVLMEEHTDNYSLVQARTIRFEDGKQYKLTTHEPRDQEPYITISNPNKTRPLLPEHLTIMDSNAPLYTLLDDGTITLIGGDQQSSNMTIVLIRNRTYKFIIDSINHPIIITEHAGEDAEPTQFVNDQFVEFGKISINTSDQGAYGSFPERLYYQSTQDSRISGTILVVDPEVIEGYSTKVDGLTSYSLNLSVSSHYDLDRLGWGMSFPDTGNAWQFYSIFEYVETPVTSTSYTNNTIDWDSDQTTIDFNVSKDTNDVYNEWFKDEGLADLMIEKELRKGLGLFDGIDSIE